MSRTGRGSDRSCAAMAVALGLGKARLAAMLVADERQSVEATARRAGRSPPLVTQDEAPPDVEVAVEREAARRAGRAPRSPRGGRPGSSPRWRRPRRPARPRSGAGRRHDPPAAGDARRSGRRGADERRHDVAGRLDAGVEDDDDRPGGATEADVRAPRRGRAGGSSRRPRRGGSSSARCRSALQRHRLLRGRRVGDDHEGRPGRRMRARPASARATSAGPVRREQHDRRTPVGGSSRRDGTPARPILTRPPSSTSGGGGGREGEVGATVDDLPAGGLDLGAQPVRLGPVVLRARAGTIVRRRQDLLRYVGRVIGAPPPAASSGASPGRQAAPGRSGQAPMAAPGRARPDRR